MLIYVEVLLIVALCYALPIVHVLRSNRTPQNMRVWMVLIIMAFGLPGYLIWLLMTTPKVTAKDVDPATLPQLPPAGPSAATLYFMRNSFYGALMSYRVYVDDREGEPAAQVRGKACTSIAVAAGAHTLWIKAGSSWFSFPFEIHAGEVRAFSLNAYADNPWKAGIEGWLDEINARYRYAKLHA